MSLIRKHVAVLQAWACLALVLRERTHYDFANNFDTCELIFVILGRCIIEKKLQEKIYYR